MTARKPRARQYHRSGLYALQGTLRRAPEDQDWTLSLGPVGEALRAWRSDLIDALGGDDAVSPQQRAIIEMAVRTHLMLESVDRYVLAMPSLVNRQKRQLFAVVRERQTLADSLNRQLATLGLERRAKPVPSLGEYLRARSSAGPPAADDHREEKEGSAP